MENEEDTFAKLKAQLENYLPLIPESVIDHLLEKAGVVCADENVKKLIALVAQKFTSDVAISSFQYHKIFQKAAQKDKRFSKEKKLTFTVQDLEKALEEQGINIGRPFYYQ